VILCLTHTWGAGVVRGALAYALSLVTQKSFNEFNKNNVNQNVTCGVVRPDTFLLLVL
jgi:hypothetical protein